MSIRVRPYRNGGWEVDIRVITPMARDNFGSGSEPRCRLSQPPCDGQRGANASCSSDS
jgi:hypothetical protein